MTQDTEQYLARKRFYDNVLTVYGRKPVLEVIQAPDITVHRLHLSTSNKPASVLDEIVGLATSKNVDIVYHDKAALSRISKNAKQDQGIAIDIHPKGFTDFDSFIEEFPSDPFELIALDRITTPQNLGLIIRSVCASPAYGLLLPKKGVAKLDSLVIKASAGTLFKARIIRCDNLCKSLRQLRERGLDVLSLEADAKHKLADLDGSRSKVFVLGNESDGVSKEVKSCCNKQVSIAMARGVESLNVAVAASLVSFRSVL